MEGREEAGVASTAGEVGSSPDTAEVSGVVLLQPGGEGWSGVWGNGGGRTRGLKGGGPGFDLSLKLAD